MYLRFDMNITFSNYLLSFEAQNWVFQRKLHFCQNSGRDLEKKSGHKFENVFHGRFFGSKNLKKLFESNTYSPEKFTFSVTKYGFKGSS